MRKSITIKILLLIFVVLFIIACNGKDTIKDQNYFIAINNGSFKIIDSSNNCISKISFDYIATLAENMYRVCKNKKWGYLNETGATVAVPLMYDASTDFSEERASVNFNGKWGYINKNNEVVIDFQYDWAGAFIHDSALVKLKNLYYLINENNVRISNYYDDCTLIYLDVYIAIENNSNTPVLVDTYGKEIYKFDNNFIETIGLQNDILCYKYRHDLDVKCKIINLSDGFTILDNLDALTPPVNDRLFYGIKQNNKLMWGQINLNTLKIGSLKYSNVISNTDKLFGVAIEKDSEILWGFIDEDENMVIEPEYYSVGSFSNGYAPIAIVNDSGKMKWGILDLSGTMIIDPQYDYIISCQ
ncbi:MAG TPA: hypothetical protein DIV40_03275 [Clostridiales bacterium]|jgi:hypothetical protein|nr:hypothetical protein [Clostridiales bacterium]